MKNFLSACSSWLSTHWRGLISAIIISALAVFTLGMGIDSLVNGQTATESKALERTASITKPWNYAVNAPYNVPAYIMGQVLNDPLQGARVVSVIFGLIAVILMFYVLKIWFSTRIATVGSLLFITSSWLLHLSHMASPLILLAATPLLCLAPLAWFLRTKKYKPLAFILFAASLAVAAYVPYMFWIIAVTLTVLVIKERKQLTKLKTWHIAVAAGIYLVLMLPLFMSLLGAPGQLLELLGIPRDFPSPIEYFKNLAGVFGMIFVYSKTLPELTVGNLPMLDIFSTVMFVLGVYYYVKLGPNRRTIILFGCFAVLLLILPLSPLYQFSAAILLPLIYICIISGIVELLNQWFAYFPRNPWARNFGVALMVVAIGFVCFYHLQSYYIAWPNAPETKAMYVVK